MVCDDNEVRIRCAELRDIDAMREIERRAGALFAAIGMSSVADDDPPTESQLINAIETGSAWVMENDVGDAVVAYLFAEQVDGATHIDQVSVLPEFAHRRIGQALLEEAARWALRHGSQALTLTTFRDVPWNAPYYEGLGFGVLSADELGPELKAVVNAEDDQPWADEPRVCMHRALEPEH